MAKELKSCRIIFVMGGPGTGKATSCRKLEEHGFKTISMNQVINEEVKSGTELGNKMKDYVLSHSMVPLNMIINSLRDCLIRESENVSNFAIIGFPKDIDQATKFEKEIANVDVAIYLKASDEVMMTRTVQRAKERGEEVDPDNHLRFYYNNNHPHCFVTNVVVVVFKKQTTTTLQQQFNESLRGQTTLHKRQ